MGKLIGIVQLYSIESVEKKEPIETSLATRNKSATALDYRTNDPSRNPRMDTVLFALQAYSGPRRIRDEESWRSPKSGLVN